MDGNEIERREEVISTLENWLKSKADQGCSSFTNEETSTQFSKAVSEAVELLKTDIYMSIKEETNKRE